MSTTKEYPLIPLFERYIRDSYNGKRLKTDGNRIKRQTVDNYVYVLNYLNDYQVVMGQKLQIKVMVTRDRKLLITERNYWKKFYLGFTNFLYTKKDCYDNYVGNVIKIIRGFFGYLNKDLAIYTSQFYKKFYVCKEEIPIVTLLPEQLQFLILNTDFEAGLTKSLQTAKDIFVFGCTVALRVSDLFSIKISDIEYVGDSYYLPVQTIKTNTPIRIKLPGYAVVIMKKFKKGKRGNAKLFPTIPAMRFNKQIKVIAEKADWTGLVGKTRSKRGMVFEKFTENAGKQYRFCDLLSSHTMRRTAILQC